jgi:hypothetical protein
MPTDPVAILHEQMTRNSGAIRSQRERVQQLRDEFEMLRARMRLIEELLTELQNTVARLPKPLPTQPPVNTVADQERDTGMRD